MSGGAKEMNNKNIPKNVKTITLIIKLSMIPVDDVAKAIKISNAPMANMVMPAKNIPSKMVIEIWF